MQKTGQSGHRKADKHMKISYNVTGSKRKELVQAISRELETEAKYCGAPGFAYEVGGLRIDRDGTVSGPDNRGLIADLEGLYSLVPTEKAYETAGISATPSDESDLEPRYTEEELGLGLHHCDPIGEDGMQADDASDTAPCCLTISLPREGMTDAAIENLRRLIANKEILIKKALELDALPIEANDTVISFPWYDKTPSPEVLKAASTLVGKLVGMAKNQKRVNVKAEEPVENMKYSFRCLLLRLGFIGPEYKDVRSTLLKNFSGSGAFKSGARRSGPRPAQPLDQTADVQASEREDASHA